MSNLSGLDPLFGGLGSEVPAEVRLIQQEDSVRDVDLLAFQLNVEKRIRILQLIAEEYLPDETESESIIIGRFSSKESEAEHQRGVERTEQILVEKLTKKTVGLFIPIPPDVSDEQLKAVKAQFAKEIAGEVYSTQRTAKKVLSWGATRRKLCPSLEVFSDDVFEISKAMIPVLVPLSLTGALAIPAQPVLYGWMALVAVRMGIKNLCRGYVKEESVEEEF